MYFVIIIFIICIFLGVISKLLDKKNINENINNYIALKNPMTETELKFCKQLKEFTKKYNLEIIPQIQLQKIFVTYNKNDIKAFNKIKSKSIDFAIVDENYNYIFFIELDDYTHKRKDRIQRDVFINELFKKYNLKLIRISPKNNYNFEQFKKLIDERF